MVLNMDIVLCVGKTVAQITAELAPIPYISPAVQILCSIIELCETVEVNKHATLQLRDRCCFLLLSFKDSSQSSDKLSGALNEIKSTLELVKDKMNTLVQKSRLQAFVDQKKIESDIRKCHNFIDNCLAKFQVTSHLEIHQWQRDFTINTSEDHSEVIEYLAEISNNQSITNGALAEHGKLIHEIMQMMQNGLAEKEFDDRTLNGLQSNLYQLQMKTNTLLPDFNLKRGEVKRFGQFPISGTPSMDIWDGMYLNGEKVAIKVVRAVHSDAKSLERFEREITIWSNIWKEDKGEHVLPFYGFCQNDGPYPYMVSPWQPNGTAITYVKANPSTVNYRNLILGIAKGIKVLHMQCTPVVHGDIKGANIVIGNGGRPLIADFGVSKIVEDITGVPFTQSHGVSESYRWFAPELCIGQGILSTSSDIYAFSMTVMELLTHQQPYAHIKHTTEAVIKSNLGVRPERPSDPVIASRGLDDRLWNLLNHCWDKDPRRRPNIHEVLTELS